MIIYFEGADGTGKSTLLNQIADWIEANCPQYVVYRYAKKHVDTLPLSKSRLKDYEFINNWHRMRSKQHEIYLIDRAMISDIIYRDFDEHEPVLNLDLAKALLPSDKVFVVWTSVCPAISHANLAIRGDDNPIATKHHGEIIQSYNKIMPHIMSRTKSFIYDYTKNSLTDIIDVLTTIFLEGESDDK